MAARFTPRRHWPPRTGPPGYLPICSAARFDYRGSTAAVSRPKGRALGEYKKISGKHFCLPLIAAHGHQESVKHSRDRPRTIILARPAALVKCKYPCSPLRHL